MLLIVAFANSKQTMHSIQQSKFCHLHLNAKLTTNNMTLTKRFLSTMNVYKHLMKILSIHEDLFLGIYCNKWSLQ